MAKHEAQVPGDNLVATNDPKAVHSDAALKASTNLVHEFFTCSNPNNDHLGKPERLDKNLFPQGGTNDRLLNTPSMTPEDLKDAQKVLDSKVSNVLPEKDQAILKSMNHALINGDSKEFGEAVAKLHGDPARIKAFVADLERSLKDSGAGVHVVVSKDGNVIAYKDGDTAGVQYNGKTGESTVVPLKNEGGNVIVENGEVLNKQPADVFQDLGRSAASNILGKNFIELPQLGDWLDKTWKHRKSPDDGGLIYHDNRSGGRVDTSTLE